MTSLPDDILDLLTAYALNALEPEEIPRVSALLEERPELRAALAELRATADKLPYGLPEAIPPADLRQRVLDYATGRIRPTAPSMPARVINRARVWMLSLGGLAVVAVLAATLGWAQLFGVRAELASVQSALASVQTQLKQTQTQVATAQQQADQLQAQIASAQRVLASLQGQTGKGAILQTSGGATVFAAQLPPLQPGRVYQLWRIQGTRAPMSVGIFMVDQQGYGATPLSADQQPQNGETVAVTNEPDGGSPGPTSDPVIKGISSNA
jgi:anti-sigma-K factor RskA